jgi:hypothetical protein
MVSECLCELKKEINTTAGNQRRQNVSGKIVEQACFLQKRDRNHAKHCSQRKG